MNRIVTYSVGQEVLNACKLCTTSCMFAGHSKWANIRHIKALKDGQKSQNFARISRLIRIAIQDGGGTDPNSNLRLAQAVEQAKKMNMPGASIQNILKHSKKHGEITNYTVMKEPGMLTSLLPKILGFPATVMTTLTNSLNMNSDPKMSASVVLIGLKGPGGCAILISVTPDNLKLTKQNLNYVLKKTRYTLSDGTWNHLFSHKGIIEADVQKHFSSDDVLSHALELGAEDVIPINNNGEEYVQFLCEPLQLQAISTKLHEIGYVIRLAHCEYIPSSQITMSESDRESLAQLYKKLEEFPEIIGIYDNISWDR